MNSLRNQVRPSSVLVDVANAIDFELPDQEGHPWRLADQLGERPVLLVFYRGDW